MARNLIEADQNNDTEEQTGGKTADTEAQAERYARAESNLLKMAQAAESGDHETLYAMIRECVK